MSTIGARLFSTARVLLMSCLTLAASILPIPSLALDLSAYQRPDGAITLHRQDGRVDPYFAIKALWAARQMGDPATVETKAWINWLVSRQSPEGGFARYCEQPNGWQACDQADADDSLLAMWIELLYEAAPRRMPPQWAHSAQLAERALMSLLDRKSGVYRAGQNIEDALLMDNVEVYAALRRVGELQRAAGDRTGGERHLAQARALRIAMAKVFRPNKKELLRWSSGDDSSVAFYPYALAHLYPWLHGMDTEGFGDIVNWEQWLDRYGEQWLTRSGDSYPWGLVAMLALREKSFPAVRRWLDTAPSLRDGANWNVLEEAILQGLARARQEGKWK